jgi:peptidoglycan biosynthesis protein MviN/MurJ (putative lipid II flippase)
MRWVALALTLGLLANIGLSCLLIPQWGLPGAAMAAALANAGCLTVFLVILHRQGWSVDSGTWIACGLPAVMVLPPVAALVAWLLVVFGAWRSDWIFTYDEKQQLLQVAARGWRKFARS